MNPCIKQLDQRLLAQDIDILQVNVGLRCNLSCRNCYLDCTPGHREIMGWHVQESVVEAADDLRPALIDITGGAPELNPHLKRFIRLLRQTHTVQLRTNLTAMTIEGLDELPDFLALHKVRIIASLPCYLDEKNCETSGGGQYKSSLDVLRRLNQLGYGTQEDLEIDLVFYHPLGPYPPMDQSLLEKAYTKELHERHGVVFNRLFTISNIPLARYLELLRVSDYEEEYMQLMESSYNASNIPAMMCRHQMNVGWDGTLYDCDFNQALGIPMNHGVSANIMTYDLNELRHRQIMTGAQCFACATCTGAHVNCELS